MLWWLAPWLEMRGPLSTRRMAREAWVLLWWLLEMQAWVLLLLLLRCLLLLSCCCCCLLLLSRHLHHLRCDNSLPVHVTVHAEARLLVDHLLLLLLLVLKK